MNPADDSSFDDQARRLHGAALDALSPRVQARLARPAGATTTPARRPGPSWAWGTAFASLAVLAVALQLRPPAAPVAGDAGAGPAPAHAPALAALAEVPVDPVAVLAEDPDFYTWLGSADAPVPYEE